MEIYHHHLLFLFTLNLLDDQKKKRGRGDKASCRWCVVVYCDRYHITKTALHQASPRQIKCLLKSNLYSSPSQLATSICYVNRRHQREIVVGQTLIVYCCRNESKPSDFCSNRRNAFEDLFTVLMYKNDSPFIFFGVDF